MRRLALYCRLFNCCNCEDHSMHNYSELNLIFGSKHSSSSCMKLLGFPHHTGVPHDILASHLQV